MNLGIHMPGGERRKHIDIEVRIDIVRKRKKFQIFVLFLEVVTLTFVLQTSLSIGFLLSPSGTCVKIEQKFETFFISARYLKNKM
jgi:hypothetical protein